MSTSAKKAAERHLRDADPVLDAIINLIGECQLTPRPGEFDSLARIICGQQLSTKAAASIFSRVVALCTNDVCPEHLSSLSDDALRGCGLSRAKVASLRDLCQAVDDGRLRFKEIPKLDDEVIAEQLIAVRGLGPWSAQMYLMFVLVRPDVFPVGDLGIRRAIERWYGLPPDSPYEAYERVADPWRPYRTYASWYLWRSLAAVPTEA